MPWIRCDANDRHRTVFDVFGEGSQRRVRRPCLSRATEPSTVTCLPELDDEGRDQAAYLIEQGLTLPTDVRFVSYVTRDEKLRLSTGCLREAGVERRPDSDSSAGERGTYELALYRWHVMYPLHSRYRPFTEQQIRTLYDYYVDQLLPCLHAEGQDAGPAPSWEYFVANFDTGQQWNPYLRVRPKSSIGISGGQEAHAAESERLRRKCPPRPPDEKLYPALKVDTSR